MTKDNGKSLELKSVSRRKAVKQIVGGVSALAAYNMLPVRWEKPIIEQIFLPAHAAVSGITLSDPCTAELVSGNQETSIDVIRVSGFVTPPVGGLEVTIVGTPNGGSGGPVTVTTTTGSDGTYSAEVTMVGGPGIIGVGATTTVAGINGAAHCSVGIPPADHPSAQPPTSDFTATQGDVGIAINNLDTGPNTVVTLIGTLSSSNGQSDNLGVFPGTTGGTTFTYNTTGNYTLSWADNGSTTPSATIEINGASRDLFSGPWTLLVT